MAAVAARFVLACRSGHLDDFPYGESVHRCAACEPGARLQMEDHAGTSGPNVTIRCLACPANRNMMDAAGFGVTATSPAAEAVTHICRCSIRRAAPSRPDC
jgi:hypothetical protein